MNRTTQSVREGGVRGAVVQRLREKGRKLAAACPARTLASEAWMDKQPLIQQVAQQLRAQLDSSRERAEDSRDAAAHVATEEEKRSDSRVVLEFGALAKGHERRSRQLQENLDALERLHPRTLSRRDPVQLGAIVEVEDESEGRTFFLLPVAAGRGITGPGGDGVLTVITASSPMGRAVMGRRVGETVEVLAGDEPREWRITYVG